MLPKSSFYPLFSVNPTLAIMRNYVPYLLFSLVLLFDCSLEAGNKDKVDELAELLFSDPEFDDPQLSPDGSHILMFTANGYSQDLASYDLTEKKMWLTRTGSGHDFIDVGWIDGDHIIYAQSTWEMYYEGMWSVSENFKKKDRRIDQDEAFHDRYLGGASIQLDDRGQRLFRLYETLPYVENEAILRNTQNQIEAYLELWRYNRSGRHFHKLTEFKDKVLDAVFDVQGRFRVKRVKGEENNKILTYHRWDEESEWELLPFEEDSYLSGFDPSGNYAYVYWTPEKRTVTQVYSLKKKEFVASPIEDPVYEVEAHMIRLPGSGNAVGYTYWADRPVVVYFNRDIAIPMNLIQKALPNMMHRYIGNRPNGDLLIESFSDRQPIVVHDLNPEERSLSRVLEQYPKINAEEMASMIPFTCETRDGATIRGYYTLPPDHVTTDKTNLPTVVMVHGGPHSRDYWGFDPEVQFYAQLGYAVLQVNYRGSSFMYEGRYYNLLDCCKVAVDDVADATQWFIDQGFADKDKVAVYGWSFGGYAAIASVERYPDLYCCAAAAAGVYDWNQLIKDQREDYDEMIKWSSDYYGDILAQREEYDKYSPVNQANKVKVPVYLLHGDVDQRVRSKQSRYMYSALKEAGADVELETPNWMGHGFNQEEKERLKYVRHIYDFLAKHLD